MFPAILPRHKDSAIDIIIMRALPVQFLFFSAVVLEKHLGGVKYKEVAPNNNYQLELSRAHVPQVPCNA